MNADTPLPLPESAKRYWWHLVPVTLFPSCAVLLLSWKQEEAWAIASFYAGFVATGVYAMLPTLRKKAKLSFWTLACGLYLAGGLLAVIVGLIRQALVQ